MAQTDDTTERDYTDKDYALANKIICAVRVRFGLLTEVEPHDLYAIDRLIATTVAADREEERAQARDSEYRLIVKYSNITIAVEAKLREAREALKGADK